MKKVLALVLAVVLVFGMTTVVSAKTLISVGASDLDRTATAGAATLFGSVFAVNSGSAAIADGSSLNGATMKTASLANITMTTAAYDKEPKITISLNPVVTAADGTAATKSQLTSDDWGVGYKIVKGSNIINKVDLDGNNARILFKKYIVVTGDVDFEVEVWLTHKKSKITDSEETVAGTFVKGSKATVDEDDATYYLGDYGFIEADGYIRNIELELNDDISLVTKLFDGKKYAGVANYVVADADMNVFDKYPEIDTVANLITSGLAASGNIVKMNYSDNYYVYVPDGDSIKYVGRSNTMLPYYTKYYLASKELKLAVAADVVDEAPVDTKDTKNAPTGGDDVVVVNSNFNPGTGR